MSSDSITNSVFQKEWWLEAVAPGQWNYATVKKGDEVYAKMPFIIKKMGPFTISTMPIFTQVLGPCFKEIESKESSRLSREKELITELLKQLPDIVYFKQRFHYSLENWLPFYWEGFEQTTRYTYILEDISDPDVVWNNMDGNIRREIKKAREQITIETSDDTSLMWKFHCSNFADQKSPEGTLDDFARVYAACKSNDSGQILVAKSGNQVVAALFIVWDENSAYYLLGGTLNEYKSTGAFSYLMYEAVKYVSDKTRFFDFEGSMIKSIEKFYRSFGGTQKPYFHITRKTKLIRFLTSLKELFSSN